MPELIKADLCFHVPNDSLHPDDDYELSFDDEINEDEIWDMMARNHLVNYFTKQQLHCGGSIPKSQYLKDDYVQLVRDGVRKDRKNGYFNIIDYCLEVINHSSPLRYEPREPERPFDALELCKVIETFNTFSIPKAFKPGMILLYLKLCKGYYVRTSKLKSLGSPIIHDEVHIS